MKFMTLHSYITNALVNLFSAKLRSSLAVLSILVGTAAIIALMTSGKLASENALAQFKRLGTSLLSVSIVEKKQSLVNHVNMQASDLVKASQVIPSITLIAPYITIYHHILSKNSIVGNVILATTPELFKLLQIKMTQGRLISNLDGRNTYAVIGSKLAYKLRQQGVIQPIGKQLHVNNLLFTIIGIIDHWQPNFFLSNDLDNSIIVPLDAAVLLGVDSPIHNALFKLKDTYYLTTVKKRLTDKIKLLFPEHDIYFHDPKQLIQIISKQKTTFNTLLIVIAGISLLVGCIGIMNIMLVAIIERRQEIGIRMALGAKPRDICLMFLIEAVILTLAGGMLGMVVGLIIAYTLAFFAQWEFEFYLLPITLSFFLSIMTGIIAGFYPAYKAAKLNPITTLQAN